MDISARFIAPGVVFLLTLACGFWLSHRGKPYNGILFNLHKLIALATVILTAVQTYNGLKNLQAQAIIFVLIILVGLCIVALFVTGALMSMNKPASSTLRTIHNIAPVVAVIVGAAVLYLLGGRP